MNKIIRPRYGISLGIFILMVAIWELTGYLLKIPEYLLPSPSQIVLRMSIDISPLLSHASITAIEAILGFSIGSLTGILTAVIFMQWPYVEIGFYPYVIALKTVPLVAIAPLLTLWFGSGFASKVVMAALLCYFPIVIGTLDGLKFVPSEMLKLMHSLSASKMQVLTKIRLPNALPSIFSALKISSTLSVIGAIVAELSGSTQGLGYIILISSYRLETSTVFTAVTLSALIGIVFFAVISFIEKQCIYWLDDRFIYEIYERR